jgi:very-short-patch-repair endonuclease
MGRDIDRARELRQRQTEAEKFVWRRLRYRRFAGFKFRRQVPLGNYILDFVCYESRLVIELDGGQHNESAQRSYDRQRDEWIRSQGFAVLRFWNHEVFTEWSIIEEVIWRELKARQSSSDVRTPEKRLPMNDAVARSSRPSE